MRVGFALRSAEIKPMFQRFVFFFRGSSSGVERLLCTQEAGSSILSFSTNP